MLSSLNLPGVNTNRQQRIECSLLGNDDGNKLEDLTVTKEENNAASFLASSSAKRKK